MKKSVCVCVCMGIFNPVERKCEEHRRVGGGRSSAPRDERDPRALGGQQYLQAEGGGFSLNVCFRGLIITWWDSRFGLFSRCDIIVRSVLRK